MIEVFHLVVFEDNHLPKNVKEANKLIRSISSDCDSTQSFKFIEIDNVTHKRIGSRWCECSPAGKISYYHSEGSL